MVVTIDERALRARLEKAGQEITVGVARVLPAWVVGEVDRILDAWARVEPAERAAIRIRAAAIGDEAAIEVRAELDELFAAPPETLRVTPLQVIRRAVRYPTAVLGELGVPPVVRDEFDERTHPDDVYDLAPRRIGDLGDPELGPLLAAWGLTRARLARHRRDPP